MVNSTICSRCGDQDETFLHCLRDCNFSIIIWQRIGFASQPFFFSNSVTDWLQEGAKCSWTSVFFATFWWLWKHCNLMCLSNETLSVTRLCCNIFSYAESISTSLRNPSSAHAPARLIRWNSNNHMCTILNVDGSFNGDPIRTGFGGVIRNNSGNYISGFSGFINNSQDIMFAEHTTLHQGPILAIRLNCSIWLAILTPYSQPTSSRMIFLSIMFMLFLSRTLRTYSTLETTLSSICVEKATSVRTSWPSLELRLMTFFYPFLPSWGSATAAKDGWIMISFC
jgi:hypothetical protein